MAQRARAAVGGLSRARLRFAARQAMEKKMSAIPSTTRIRSSSRWVRWLATWPNRVVTHLQRREAIKMLHELNDHQLRDIGLRRDQIEEAVTCGKRRFSR